MNIVWLHVYERIKDLVDDNLRYSRVLEHSPRTTKLNHNYSIKHILSTGVTERERCQNSVGNSHYFESSF